MTDVLQTAEGAVVAASIYLLVGLGWNVVYNACGYLNLAIGGFYVLAAVLSFEVAQQGWVTSPVLVALLVLVGMGVLGFITERALLRPMKRRGLELLIVTSGLELVLGEVNRRLAPEVVVRPGDFAPGAPFDLGGVLVGRQDVVVVVTAAAAFGALVWFFQRTDRGRVFRACTDDRAAALALGVDVARVETTAFVLGVGLTSVAALTVAPIQGVAAGGGTMIAIKSFLAVSLGGIGSNRGAVLGSLGVALTEAYLARYWNTDARDLIVLTGLVLVLALGRTGVPAAGAARPAWRSRR